MKKLLTVLVLAIFLFASQAHAYYCPPPVLAPDEALASPGFFPFAGAVGFAAFVIYANATGLPFPLCGVNGWTCTSEYPDPVHKDGV